MKVTYQNKNNFVLSSTSNDWKIKQRYITVGQKTFSAPNIKLCYTQTPIHVWATNLDNEQLKGHQVIQQTQMPQFFQHYLTASSTVIPPQLQNQHLD